MSRVIAAEWLLSTLGVGCDAAATNAAVGEGGACAHGDEASESADAAALARALPEATRAALRDEATLILAPEVQASTSTFATVPVCPIPCLYPASSGSATTVVL